ncbi:hypothetical protein, partial [Lelliottia amnigena]|uniref:hypothetical protein n=1 Tax=Lelliottia amnigena TaxID=61646 RepID=UPI0021D8AF37
MVIDTYIAAAVNERAWAIKLSAKCAMLAIYHCLSGSEQSSAISFNVFESLSCLYGSERCVVVFVLVHSFLSCLCGSELKRLLQLVVRNFLSCLCGSERGVPTNKVLP